jgi:hypothetical protein
MTPALFGEACKAVWGERWRHLAAAALDVSERTVRRWAAGEQAIPASATARLLAVVSRHVVHLSMVQSRLQRLQHKAALN